MNFLKHTTIIMTETTLPANIGAAARAMMTMGFKNLTLVNPKHPIDATSYSLAKGGQEILTHAQIVPSLTDALCDKNLIIAASSRNRQLPKPMLTPKTMAHTMQNFYQAHGENSRIALVFGREDRGLSNDELMLAHYHVQIHANPEYCVLNVASSVQVLCAFLYDFICDNDDDTKTDAQNAFNTLTLRTLWDTPAINLKEQNKLQDAFLSLLHTLELADDNHLADLPKRIARLGTRLQLDKKEYALLMALIFKLKNLTE